MAVLLDSKDLAKIDQEYAAESVVWSVLAEGARAITEEDFVGANEVRLNTLAGFCAADYKRNDDNGRAKLSVGKVTVKLGHERWMAYDLDAMDRGENQGLDIQTVVEEHTRKIVIPEKDRVAMRNLLNHSGKMVEEIVTAENALQAFDAAEQYMLDNDFTGPYVMFASSDYYRKLKNCPDVARTFTTNMVSLAGIDRRVTMLDSDIPIIKVGAERIQLLEGFKVNFVLLPMRAAAPVEKYNDITLVPAESDRDGYRDTVKGLNYYDLVIFPSADAAIYVSLEETT